MSSTTGPVDVTVYMFLCEQDLRLQDNKQLKTALDLGLPIIFVHCISVEKLWNAKWMNCQGWGLKRREFKLQCLQDLDNRLTAYICGADAASGANGVGRSSMLWVTTLGKSEGLRALLESVNAVLSPKASDSLSSVPEGGSPASSVPEGAFRVRHFLRK